MEHYEDLNFSICHISTPADTFKVIGCKRYSNGYASDLRQTDRHGAYMDAPDWCLECNKAIYIRD